MLGDHRSCRLRRPGSALRTVELRPVEHPANAVVQEGTGAVEGGTQGLRIALGQFAGVCPIGHVGDEHLDVVAALPAVEPVGGRTTGPVGVEGQHQLGREPGHQLHVVVGQRRATGRYRLGDPRPMTADDVGVALAHHDPPSVHDRLLGPVQGVEHLALVVDAIGRRVLVLRLLPVGQHAATERDGRSVRVVDGKHQTVPKEVRRPAARVLERQPSSGQLGHRRLQVTAELVPPRRRIAEPEPLHCLAVVAATS